MKLLILPVLLVTLCGISAAQTTYTMPPSGPRIFSGQFYCDAASSYPVTSFYQFSCRGIPMADGTGSTVGSFFFYANRIQGTLPVAPFINPYTSHPVNPPTGKLPGTFTFMFVAQDQNGEIHNGSANVTWHNKLVCGGERCWYHPVLDTFSITLDPQ